jgi:hypothetical protein
VDPALDRLWLGPYHGDLDWVEDVGVPWVAMASGVICRGGKVEDLLFC